MVLHAADRIHKVGSAGNSKSGIEVIVQAPGHAVLIQAILLDAQVNGLIRIVAKTDSSKQDLVEQMSVAVLGVDGQAAAQQTDTVTVVDVAAILADVAEDLAESIPGLERLRNIVVARIFAARRPHLIGRGRHHLLRTECAGAGDREDEADSFQWHHLRKNWSAFDP